MTASKSNSEMGFPDTSLPDVSSLGAGLSSSQTPCGSGIGRMSSAPLPEAPGPPGRRMGTASRGSGLRRPDRTRGCGGCRGTPRRRR